MTELSLADGVGALGGASTAPWRPPWIFGVRHNDPRSGAALEAFLEATAPAAVLIEGPPEADPLIALSARADMRPPVALVATPRSPPPQAAAPERADRLNQTAGALVYPFADYAPEWRAMLWAVSRARPIRFIDAPAGVRLAQRARAVDPAVEDALREAFMRRAVAQAVRAHGERIAVVCGAAHAPALSMRNAQERAREDRALVAAAGRRRALVAWSPWRADALGDAHPGWSAFLWAHRCDSRAARVAAWCARAASALRAAGRPVGAAQAIDAARLAEALATLRGLEAGPGPDELLDAARASMVDGSDDAASLLAARLLWSSQVGSVPPEASAPPLVADILGEARRLRLVDGAAPRELRLDARTEAGRVRSRFLHRLALLGLDVAERLPPTPSDGARIERWRLADATRLRIAAMRASADGANLAAAATLRGRRRISGAATGRVPPSVLAETVEMALAADAPALAAAALGALAKAAPSTDPLEALRAPAPIARGLVEAARRAGGAGARATQALRDALDALMSQAAAAAPRLSRDLAKPSRPAAIAVLRGADAALRLAAHRSAPVGDGARAWRAAVSRLATATTGDAALRGAAAALDGARRPDQVSSNVAAALRRPETLADWLTGFFAPDGPDALTAFDAIDAALAKAPAAVFERALPALAEALASLSSSERDALWRRVAGGGAPVRETPPAEFGALMSVLEILLGPPASAPSQIPANAASATADPSMDPSANASANPAAAPTGLTRRWARALGLHAAEADLTPQERAQAETLRRLHGPRAPALARILPEIDAAFAPETAAALRRAAVERTAPRARARASHALRLTDLSDRAAAELLAESSGAGAAPLDPALDAMARRLVAQTAARLTPSLRAALHRLGARCASGGGRARGVDWTRMLRANLHRYDPVRRAILIEKIVRRPAARRAGEVAILLDRSRSMASARLSTAVTAAALAEPGPAQVHAFAFDEHPIDMSERLGDPLAFLRLGFGEATALAPALRAAATRLARPDAATVYLLSDLIDGGDRAETAAAAARLVGAGARLIALTPSDGPAPDQQMTATLRMLGAQVISAAPDALPARLAEAFAGDPARAG